MEAALFFDAIPVCISKRVIKNQQTTIKHSKREPIRCYILNIKVLDLVVYVLTVQANVTHVPPPPPPGWVHFGNMGII